MSTPVGGYWNHNVAFHGELVADAGLRGGRVLDVGCGDGLLVHRLAGVCDEVVGIEKDPAAARRAAWRTAGCSRATIRRADVLDPRTRTGLGVFQTVICVAVVHHLPLGTGLRAVSELVAPGGRLLVVGLAANRSAWDWTLSALSALPIWAASRWHRETRDIGVPVAQARQSLGQIRAVAGSLLPGARVRRRFYYRYTLTWDRPRRDR